MKHFLGIALTLVIGLNGLYAQKKPAVNETVVPCNGEADALPGKYTDHTKPKYPINLRGTLQEKMAMTNQLIALEKLEEASRKDFKLTGCVARVSFSGGDKSTYGNFAFMRYGYQLGVYQNVCHITKHVVKTVSEYRTVLRVDVNPQFPSNLLPQGTGEFYLTDKSIRYDIPIDAKQGPGYNTDRAKHPGRISQYLSEEMVLAGRSDNYNNKHAEFTKFISGEGYVENWLHGSRDKRSRYEWVDRHYLITRAGVPLVIPVTRKQFLEDLLEYFEIEKANFYYDLENKIKNNAGSNSESAKKRKAILEADKAAYPQLYEAKKAKVKELLATQKTEWLLKPAVVDINNISYDANQRLADIGKFYETETDKKAVLYIFNPEYFKPGVNQPTKALFMEVQFRYEIADDRGFSERLFNNFLKNYDFSALRKMVGWPETR